MTRTYYWKSASFMNSVSYVTHIVMTETKRQVTAKAGLPSETPTGNVINPIGDAIYIDSFSFKLIHLYVEVDLYYHLWLFKISLNVE